MADLTPEQMYPILKFFAFDHLPRKLKETSRPFASLAQALAVNLPYCPETEAGLRKLLEAKDCAVRAALENAGAGHD